MNRSGILATGAVLLVATLIGCKQVPVEQAAPRLSDGDGGASDRLSVGREIYVSKAKCAGCHGPKPVADYTADKWTDSILPDMGKKAKLSADEYQSVLTYVTAAAATPPR